ncbi:Lsr2 family DNA-binding protein [Rhodococcus wratislaviensis]|uniref:Lsr2 family DNA-binding protein n=1 Tax=Rhodococcus wratislaviensis TaxID=44752 RepID=UPI000691BE5F|nr:histone-like nucleoid-structuring protein Lsr2 [Rhodococcus wratislaviensis]
MGKAPAKTTTKDIREWAIGEDREVSPRGRISAEIEQAFHDAQATKAQAKTLPAKKTAVEKFVEKEAPVDGPATGTAPAKKTAKEIREWAIGEGREVSFRGRISAAIMRAFHDAAAKLPAVGG